MNEKIRWGIPIAMGIVLIIVILILNNSASKMAKRFEKLPDQFSEVVITLEDNRYHQDRCQRIRGDLRRVTYREAVNMYCQPCPACFPDALMDSTKSSYN